MRGEVVEALEGAIQGQGDGESRGMHQSRMMELDKLGWRNLDHNCQIYQGWDNL